MAAGGVGAGLPVSSGADRRAGVCGTTGDSSSDGAGAGRGDAGDAGACWPGAFVADGEAFGEIGLVGGGLPACPARGGFSVPDGAIGDTSGGVDTGGLALTGPGLAFGLAEFVGG